jgi:hypothetical protein
VADAERLPSPTLALLLALTDDVGSWDAYAIRAATDQVARSSRR